MEGAREAYDAAGPGAGHTIRPRPLRRWQRALGPGMALAVLLLASQAVAPHLSVAVWALMPVVVVAIIVAGLLGSLLDTPAGHFSGRLSAYATVVAWLWRALMLYAAGLVLFVGTIWLFSPG